jgi:hypothetical protein
LNIGDFAGPLTHENQALLFEVVERQRFDPQEFEAQKEQARETVRSERLNRLLASLVTQRRDELGVTYDEQLLANFNLVPGIEG